MFLIKHARVHKFISSGTHLLPASGCIHRTRILSVSGVVDVLTQPEVPASRTAVAMAATGQIWHPTTASCIEEVCELDLLKFLH